LPASIKTLGDWIRAKRQEKQLSPYHLAAKMGIATALVQSWENGTCQPDDRQRQMLRTVFDCDATTAEYFDGLKRSLFSAQEVQQLCL
jgi:DNA-binding transcriptional regulator YiaG